LPLESSFDTPGCDGKTTAASKGSLPCFCRLLAPPLPDEVATSRTAIEGMATNRQPSKKDRLAVSIH
jgi:hypothetical protein